MIRFILRFFIMGAAALLIVFSARAETTPPSPAPWQQILSAYVVEGADGINRMRYGALQASPEDRATLDAYIDSFKNADLSAQTPENFAALANLYNAVTVRHIVERYPVGSIKDGYLFGGPWKKVKTLVGGKRLSLDTIEHDILRSYGDPRVHYALNCASLGCPDLRKTAWTAATLDEDLDAAARAYINHPRGVTITEKGLILSSIYDWFEKDFGENDAAMLVHLKKYAKPELAKQITAVPHIKSYAYDWSLNDID